MKYHLKNYFTVTLVLIIYIFAVSMAIMSCTNLAAPTVNTEIPKEHPGSVFVQVNMYLEDVNASDELFLDYSKYEVKTVFVLFRTVGGFVRLNFNNTLIEQQKFIELLEEECFVISASSNPPWKKGEMTVKLSDNVTGDLLDDFLLSYSDYKVELIFHDRIKNRIQISFDHNLIDEHDFLLLLIKDSRVGPTTQYGYRIPDWEPELLFVWFHDFVAESEIELLLQSYSMYDVKISTVINTTTHFSCIIHFNENLINEFDIHDIFRNNPMVYIVQFLYYISVEV